MTKREKILLQICIAIGLVGMTSIYLLKPSIQERQEQKELLEAVQLEEVQIKTVLEVPDLEEIYEEQKTLADKNYQYFYDELNTYTIDGILNRLIEENGLEVESVSIGSYVEIDTDTLLRNGEKAEATEETTDAEDESTVPEMENLLLGCHATLTVTGSYQDIMALVDALEAESTCIEVTSLNIYKNERSADPEKEIQASLGLLVYGINDTIQEGEDD